MNKELYQIGLPVACLTTVIMLWNCYDRPCHFLIIPAKRDEWAIVELRHAELAAAIVRDIQEAQLKTVDVPIKTITL